DCDVEIPLPEGHRDRPTDPGASRLTSVGWGTTQMAARRGRGARIAVGAAVGVLLVTAVGGIWLAFRSPASPARGQIATAAAGTLDTHPAGAPPGAQSTSAAALPPSAPPAEAIAAVSADSTAPPAPSATAAPEPAASASATADPEPST